MTSTKSLFTALAVSFAFGAMCGAANAASLASGKKLEVNIDPAKVSEETKALWDRFGGWCAIAEWHPAIKSCEESKEGDDVYRTLTLQDGATIKEKLLDKSDVSYRYAIVESPLPVKNYEAQFSVVPDDDDLDEVNVVWAATYDAADGKDDKEARQTIDGIFKDGLANVEKMIGKTDGDDDKPKDKD
jgi:Polyketide cyclase / dehydrase and lipid transport